MYKAPNFDDCWKYGGLIWVQNLFCWLTIRCISAKLSMETINLYCDPHWNRLSETIPMSGIIIGFGWEIRKLASWKLSILDLICCPEVNGHFCCRHTSAACHTETHSLATIWAVQEPGHRHGAVHRGEAGLLWPSDTRQRHRTHRETPAEGHRTGRGIFVTLSAKRCLMEEQTVSSVISCFHTFVIVFMINTA